MLQYRLTQLNIAPLSEHIFMPQKPFSEQTRADAALFEPEIS